MHLCLFSLLLGQWLLLEACERHNNIWRLLKRRMSVSLGTFRHACPRWELAHVHRPRAQAEELLFDCFYPLEHTYTYCPRWHRKPWQKSSSSHSIFCKTLSSWKKKTTLERWIYRRWVCLRSFSLSHWYIYVQCLVCPYGSEANHTVVVCSSVFFPLYP